MEPLTIPDKLYGRDKDIAALLASFERISSGHGDVLLVPGPSGVGKTALVQELRKPIRERNGFFIKRQIRSIPAKYPLFRVSTGTGRTLPRIAVRGCAATLAFQGRHSPGHGRAWGRFWSIWFRNSNRCWEANRHSATSARRKPGTALPMFSVTSSRSSVSPNTPWSCSSTTGNGLTPLPANCSSSCRWGCTLRYLLVIVSYRDNEVDSGHPLMSAVDSLRSQAVPVDVLQVRQHHRPGCAGVRGRYAAAGHGGCGRTGDDHPRQDPGESVLRRSFLGFLHEFNRIWFDKARNAWQWLMDNGRRTRPAWRCGRTVVMKFRRLDNGQPESFLPGRLPRQPL